MTPAQNSPEALPLDVAQWFNSNTPISLSDLRGKVVVIEAFQMLCPGCILHGIPQAQRIRTTFSHDDVIVLGLHTVFEHHAAMEPVSLAAFLHEFNITFPVGVDTPGNDAATPKTMRSWGQRGTPTLWLVDKAGRLRAEHFGQSADMKVGSDIATLVAEIEKGQTARDSGRLRPSKDAGDTVCQPTDKTGDGIAGAKHDSF